jgi:deazaflavin-dependent oxidoreductase (nitroreductase family)
VSRVVNPLIAMLGVKPVLATLGRRSGKWRTVPVNVLEHGGARYLIAPRGDTHWVRNLQENPEAELRHRGSTERIRAVPVPEAERPELIKAYRERWESEVRGYFEKLPDPTDHPVFRIEPVS